MKHFSNKLCDCGRPGVKPQGNALVCARCFMLDSRLADRIKKEQKLAKLKARHADELEQDSGEVYELVLDERRL